MGSERRAGRGGDQRSGGPAPAAGTPGKRTLTDPWSAAVGTAASPAGAGRLPRLQLGAHDEAGVHAAASRGVATPATALPFAATIQRAFGRHDISSVRAHAGGAAAASAQEMGAAAYATGNDVVLGEHADLFTVAHEAAHVVQQRAGVHLQGGVGEAGDAYEQHADRVAERVVSGQSAEALLDEHARTSASGARGGAVQRTLKVGTQQDPKDYTRDYKELGVLSVDLWVNDVITKIRGEVPAHSPLANELEANLAAICKQIAKWIEDEPGQAGSHPVFGRKKQNRHYANHAELAQGALGWVKSKGNRHREKEVARRVYQDQVLDVYFSSLLHKAALKVQNLHLFDPRVDEAHKNNIITELSTGQSVVPGHEGREIGHYRHVFDHHAKADQVRTHIPNGNMLSVLQNAHAFDVKNKIVVFHDLMEYFGNARAWVTPGRGQGLLPEPTPDKGHSTTAINGNGNRTASTTHRGMAWAPSFNNATRNENEAGTQLARQHDIPVWAGQSMTTVRVENLAEWLGATKEEKTALAWAIFAFWRLDYDQTSEWAYHTLHEVMDAASNFGVDYNMLAPYQGLGMFTLDHLKADLRARWHRCQQAGLGLLLQLQVMTNAHPLHEALSTFLMAANQALINANQWFQQAGALPPEEQVGAAHPIMQSLNECELNLNHALALAARA